MPGSNVRTASVWGGAQALIPGLQVEKARVRFGGSAASGHARNAGPCSASVTGFQVLIKPFLDVSDFSSQFTARPLAAPSTVQD